MFHCCISLVRYSQFVINFEDMTLLIEEKNDFLFHVMSSLCAQHQPQMASRRQTGYYKGAK